MARDYHLNANVKFHKWCLMDYLLNWTMTNGCTSGLAIVIYLIRGNLDQISHVSSSCKRKQINHLWMLNSTNIIRRQVRTVTWCWVCGFVEVNTCREVCTINAIRLGRHCSLYLCRVFSGVVIFFLRLIQRVSVTCNQRQKTVELDDYAQL